jgi:predicted transcriptional regulator
MQLFALIIIRPCGVPRTKLREKVLRITITTFVLLESAVTLTVRLDSAVESALERHCAERGVTKSAVVQESLAAYLWGDSAQNKAADGKRASSAVFEAFRQAGLVGAGELGGASADKKAVRARAMQRIRRSAVA